MSETAKKGPKGTKANQAPGPFIERKGDVTYVAAFPGSFVSHTEADARKNAEVFCHLAPVGIYRIELVDVVQHAPLPEGPPGRAG